MHPKKSLLCTISLAFIAVLLWRSSPRTETLSDRIKRFVHGEADTLFALSAESPTLVRQSGNYFLFIQPVDQTKDLHHQGRKAQLFEVNKGLLWEKTGVFERWSDISGSESVLPKVATGYLLDEETGVTEIFDAKGMRLAEIRGPTFLHPSPNGAYFYTVPSPMEGGWLQVYDSLGNRPWSRIPALGFWNVAFPPDSFLVYVDNDSLLLLSAKNGRTLIGWTAEPYKGKVGLTSDFVVSRNGKYFLLSQSAGRISSLFSFSGEVGFLWSAESTLDRDKEYLADIALGPDGKILGATFVPKEQRTYRILSFFDNLKKGKLISEFKFDVGQSYTGCPKSSIEIYDNLATVVLPSAEAFYYRGFTEKTATKIFIFEPKNLTVVDSLTVNGFFTPVSSSTNNTQYFRLTYDEEDKKILVLRSK